MFLLAYENLIEGPPTQFEEGVEPCIYIYEVDNVKNNLLRKVMVLKTRCHVSLNI